MILSIDTIVLGRVNCYLVKTEKGFVLIDSGGCTIFDLNLPEIRAKLDNELDTAGCRPGNLMLIILTHGDPDHSGNCAYLRSKFGAKIAMHRGDLLFVEDGILSNGKIKSFMAKIIMILTGFRQSNFMKIMDQFEKFTPDLIIDWDTDISECGFNAKIIHLPGHTRGSIGILTGDGSFFCGDIFSNFGKPMMNMIAEDFTELKSSIRKIKSYDIKTVYPGHGKPFQAALLKYV